MMEQVQKQMRTRVAIVKLARQIMNGIDESFLMRRGKPVIILVDGDENSGKKIIPDTAVDYIADLLKKKLTNKKLDHYFEGNENYDEYNVFGLSEGESLAVSFINTAFMSAYSEVLPKLSTADITKIINEEKTNPYAKIFLNAVKQFSGVAFIHNADHYGNQEQVPYYDIALRLDFQDQDKKYDPDDWNRNAYISGNPKSPVFTSSRFQLALSKI